MDELPQQNVELSFSNDSQESLDLLKKKLVEALALRIHDRKKSFGAQVDATNSVLCAILPQTEEGNIGIHIVMSIKK